MFNLHYQCQTSKNYPIIIRKIISQLQSLKKDKRKKMQKITIVYVINCKLVWINFIPHQIGLDRNRW